MPNITLTATDGSQVIFVDKMIGQGGVKDVYMSPDRSYVVAFFRKQLDPDGRERVKLLTSAYRERIFDQPGGSYWSSLYCWPEKIVEWNGRIGITAPTYAQHYFFQHGSLNNDALGIRGKEKEGKWFASAKNRSRFLDPKELGSWLSHVRVCLLISRAVRRLHAAGLAHSDLSYKNVLIDPAGGHACIIDIDGLVVPNKFPPDVVGTPDFIAPEVIATDHLSLRDPARKLPSIVTDRHALAVLIYMYLLYRHPLRGDKVHDTDPMRDEKLSMGARALFIEDPRDRSNRPKLAQAHPSELPWKDCDKLPYTLTGPYLAPLFLKAFTEGLTNPMARPTADEWESALVKTVDLVQPCSNSSCLQKWYVFDNSTKPVCPFCRTQFRGVLPVLNLYSSRRAGKFSPDNHRLMVYNNQSFFTWHVDRNVFPNERVTDDQKKRAGYFVYHNNQWHLVNERMPELKELPDKPIPIGQSTVLTDGKQLLLSSQPSGRLVVVQLVHS